MAKVGAQRAAVLTGRSKSTIQRAMDAGKLSYEMADNGRRVIDVSELERVFGLNTAQVANDRKKPTQGLSNVNDLERAQLRAKSLEDQMFLLNQQMEDLKTQRDSWQKQAQQLAITHQVTQDQASDAKKQAEEYKSRVDASQKAADEARMAIETEKARTEMEKAKAEAATRELDELKQIAAKMKQRLLSQQAAQPPAKKPIVHNNSSPRTLLALLGFGGRKSEG